MTRVGSAASTVTRRVAPTGAHRELRFVPVATSSVRPSSSKRYVGPQTVLPPWVVRPSSTMTASSVTGRANVEELTAGLRSLNQVAATTTPRIASAAVSNAN